MLSDDQIRLLSSLLISFIGCLLINRIRTPTSLIGLSIAMACLLQMYVYKCPRKWVGRIILIESFTFLLLIQLRRMYISYCSQQLDVTTILMMQIFLYIGFAFNYQDGQSPSSTHDRSIAHLPTYTQFLGYVFFLPACLVGPVFEYKDYYNYLHRLKQYKYMSSNLSAILQEMKIFVVCLLIFIVSLKIDLHYMITTQFAEQTAIYQIAYTLISSFCFKFKYYAAWSFSMLGMHATGITYNPQITNDKVVVEKWDRILTSKIYIFETSPSMKKKADAWNISVQLALKRYIYQRIYLPTIDMSDIQRKKLQIKAQNRTLFVSALWHGLYPGYFVSFFHWGLMLHISQQLYRYQQSNFKFSFWRAKIKYLELIVVTYLLYYFGLSFIFMSWENMHIFFSSNHFIPAVILYCTYILIGPMRILHVSKPKHSNLKKDNDELKSYRRQVGQKN